MEIIGLAIIAGFFGFIYHVFRSDSKETENNHISDIKSKMSSIAQKSQNKDFVYREIIKLEEKDITSAIKISEYVMLAAEDRNEIIAECLVDKIENNKNLQECIRYKYFKDSIPEIRREIVKYLSNNQVTDNIKESAINISDSLLCKYMENSTKIVGYLSAEATAKGIIDNLRGKKFDDSLYNYIGKKKES